ncbi:odorant receptor 4-like isoform X2 [Rhynchophorus ferrugineus]|uniref:odorant receptor 4-like isoform X2 n=1 Tax=Rhynchophorus ferrugineus TaxID=354439 RepID=UPI003FCCD17F
MAVLQNRQFLNFNILILKICFLWPDDINYVYDIWRLLKDSIMILSLLPCAIPIFVDFISLFQDSMKNLTQIVENMIALNCIIGMVYMVICFISNRKTIRKLVVVRSQFPFKLDHSPIYEIVFVHQIYTCTMVSIVVLSLTMLLCGLLMHTVNQLNNLRAYIRKLQECQMDKLLERLIYIIRFHIDIIKYSKEIADAFSTMLLFYITLTSLVLSVLCFEIIMVDAFEDSVRFSLHLVGWLVILFSVCYNGQLLIDESLEVANDIYSIQWFNFSVDMQQKVQMIMLRSQKPLSMSAANMGIVSLQAFLKVMSTAYSFFTLLLKFK